MNQWWQGPERTPADNTPSESVPYVDVTPPRLGDNDEISANDDRPPPRGRPMWRRVGDPLLVLAAAATFFAVTSLVEDRVPPGSDSAAAPVASQSAISKLPVAAPSGPAANTRRLPAGSPRFVVPATARPGEQITLVGYRDAQLCGPTALRFDGHLISHQLRASARPAAGAWVELYLTVTIPSEASFGSHGLELLGPVSGGQSGVLCGDEPEHQDRLTGAEIIVVP